MHSATAYQGYGSPGQAAYAGTLNWPLTHHHQAYQALPHEKGYGVADMHPYQTSKMYAGPAARASRSRAAAAAGYGTPGQAAYAGTLDWPLTHHHQAYQALPHEKDYGVADLHPYQTSKMYGSDRAPNMLFHAQRVGKGTKDHSQMMGGLWQH